MCPTLVERFLSHIDHSSGPEECWEWTGSKCSNSGYGKIKINKSMVMSSRASYELFIGYIPEGLKVLHTCDNPGCVNPSHLFLGTQSDNMIDASYKGRLPSSKLTRDKVRIIRYLYSTGGVLQKDLASQFRVSPQQISNIVNNKYWKERNARHL